MESIHSLVSSPRSGPKVSPLFVDNVMRAASDRLTGAVKCTVIGSTGLHPPPAWLRRQLNSARNTSRV